MSTELSPDKSTRDLCSVIVPVYQEGRLLWTNGCVLGKRFDVIFGKGRWRFVIVENGSRDDTLEYANKLRDEYPASDIVMLPAPDYGAALRAGLEAAQSKYAAIINIEQWDLPFLNWAWNKRGEYDLFLGSKRADPTLNGQSRYRKFLSWGLNSMLGLMFEFTVADTHGPKFMNLDIMSPIIASCTMTRGQFDTEMTLRAIRAGISIAEAPVAYLEERPPRNTMIRKIAQNIIDLWRLARRMREVPYRSTIRVRRYCRDDLTSMLRPAGLTEDRDPRAYW